MVTVTVMEVIPTISSLITIIIRVATAVTGVIMMAIEVVTAAIEADIIINHCSNLLRVT